MALSDEAQAAINDAVAIVAEDRLWSKIQERLAPTDPPPDPETPPDDRKPGPPPPKPDDPPVDKPKSKSLWWNEVEAEEEVS